MPRLLTSEIFLIAFVISLWLISILVCLRRYSLFLCFHKRDVPFYNASLINVSTKIAAEESTLNSTRPLSPVNKYQSCTWNNTTNTDNEILLHSNSNSILNKSNTISTNNQTESLNNQFCLDSVAPSQLVIKNSNYLCKNCNRFQNKRHRQHDCYKSLSNCYFSYNQNQTNINKSSTQNSNFGSNNKRMKHKLRFGSAYSGYEELGCSSNDYFFSNGILYPNSSRHGSSLLNNKTNTPHPSPKQPLHTSTRVNQVSNSNSNSSQILVQNVNERNLILKNKRALIRNKHFNLMSLDESALNQNRDFSFKQSQLLSKKKNLNLTIQETSNDIADEAIVQPSTSPKDSPKKSNAGKLSNLATLATPHANFISLRSGSDSANSGWIKPGRSYDYDNCDSNEMFSSSSLQQSQFLQPPSVLNLQNGNTQRQINPISSLRRHMFVNSRHTAQTTIDYSIGPRYREDSLNNEQSYDLVNSISIASGNVFSNALASSPNDKSANNVQIQPPLGVVEANECENPNLLNPGWIPHIVKRTLLEMHERAVLSKSDSNIKSKYRSSNHLLHSPSSIKNQGQIKSGKLNSKKKPLSLQNSQDKSNFYSTGNANAGSSRNTSNSNGSSYLNSFYEELRQKFFQLNSASIINKSPSASNTISTNVSSVAFKQDSKLNSLENWNQTPISAKRESVDTIGNLNENVDVKRLEKLERLEKQKSMSSQTSNDAKNIDRVNNQ